MNNLVSSTAYYCNYPGEGEPSPAAITSGVVSHFRATYSVSVTWAAQKAYDGVTDKEEGEDPRSPAEKLAMANTKYSFSVVEGGNVKLLASTDTAATAEEASHAIKVTFAADGSLNENCEDVNPGWFCVRTNNPSGLEYVHSGTTPAALKDAGQEISTSAAEAAGNAKYDGTSYEISVYSGGWSATGKYMHDADALKIAANKVASKKTVLLN